MVDIHCPFGATFTSQGLAGGQARVWGTGACTPWRIALPAGYFLHRTLRQCHNVFITMLGSREGPCWHVQSSPGFAENWLAREL